MTAAAVPAGIVLPRPAWRSLLWIAPLTLLWILLIYRQPAISASGVPTAAPRLMAYGLIGLGLWLGGWPSPCSASPSSFLLSTRDRPRHWLRPRGPD